MKKPFGSKEGQAVSLYTIENEKIRITVTDYGAALVSFIEKESGIDVVHGFDTLEGYMYQDGACIGASIGRTANRTGKGILKINGKTYHLFINNNGNSHHGGREGFDKKVFQAEEYEDRVVFTRLSPDMEENYPGNLQVKISYVLLEDGVAIEVEGTSDQDTVFAYTNHSYFNLDGEGSVLDHEVKINAEKYGLTDENGMMIDRLEDVGGTPFDFREFKALGKEIDADNEQIRLGAGYDHYFAITGEGFREMAYCRGKKLQLTAASDMPGMHMYTANFLNGQKGKYGHVYQRRSAVCFEAEYYPNAVNYDDFEKPYVRANETMKHRICYTLKKI